MSGRASIKMKSSNIKKSNKNIKSNQENENKSKYDPENDSSVLKKPFVTSVSGFSGVLKAFNNATTEVKDYLSNECDILYECRVCKNIFRSLSNFITHKRSYCLDKYSCVIHLKCSNKIETQYTALNVKENTEQNPTKSDNEENCDEEIPRRTTRKSLQTLVESLAQKKQFGIERKDFSISDFYKERNPDPFKNDATKNDAIKINLEHINGSNSGVFQTFKSDEDCTDKTEEMKLEVKEIHDMLEGQSVVLGPDGKILDFNSGNTVRLGITSGDSPEDKICGICKMKFATRKTYMSHMKYKHANSRLVYPCPECPDILATSWSVYRHLFNIHHKTLAQVKKLRNHIQAKAYYQVQSSFNKKQNSNSQKSMAETIDDKNEEWIDNFETDNDIQMCGGCGKRFERRAALNSHSQTCQKRIAAKNTIVVNRLKRTATEEKLTQNEAMKNPPKVPKFDVPDITNIDRRKANVIRKRKIGIQIRYDYTKPSDKSLNNSLIREDIRTIKTYDLTANDSEEQISTSPVHNSTDFIIDADEICSVIGVKSKHAKPTVNKDPFVELETVSINSSTNTTPNKETIKEEISDSEIEEILTPTETENNLDQGKNVAIKTENKLDDTAIEIIKLFNSTEPPSQQIDSEEMEMTLDKKMSDFVNLDEIQCTPCNINFGNLSELQTHMSKHFNWMKYKCDICSFKSYEKIAIIDHIDKIHNLDDPSKIEAVILQISEAETIKMATDFIPLSKNNEQNIPPLLKNEEQISLPLSQNEEQKILSLSENREDFIPLSLKNEDQNSLLLPLNNDEQNESEKICDENITQDLTQDDLEEISKDKNEKEDSQKYQKTSRGRGRPRKRKAFQGKKESLNEDSNPKESDESGIEQSQPDKSPTSELQDVAIRKMVLEVIFGQNNDTNVETESLISNSDSEHSKSCQSPELPPLSALSRPVRNRIKPSVLTNKDFIYDLKDFTDLPRPLSQNSHQSKQNKSPDKVLSKSFEDLSVTVKNKSKKNIGKNFNNTSINRKLSNSNLDLSNVDFLQSNAKRNIVGNCSNNQKNSFEIKSKLNVDIQKSDNNEIWIIDDD